MRPRSAISCRCWSRLVGAVFAVALFVIEHAGWKGLIFAGLDMTTYVVFFVVFFLGLFMAPRG